MMKRDPEEPAWRVWRRLVFATLLVSALLIGLFLSFRPAGFDSDSGDVVSDDQTTPPPRVTRRNTPTQPDPTQPPQDQPTEAATQDQAKELIANARDPEATSVQVLDAGAGSAATAAAAETLQELGYDVVAINTSRADYEVTTILYTEGSDAEAEALRARDDRFSEIAPNERLSDAVDIHVVVGPDWSE